MRAYAKVVSPGAKAERQARDVANRSFRAPAPRAAVLMPPATRDGARALTPTGLDHFETLVGAPLDGARVHVGPQSDRLAQLAGAEALTYGSDVFIPPSQFSPQTPHGRSLIAHELAHVAQAPALPGAIFRKDTPHYPSRDEQAEIERLLGHHSAAPVKKAPVAGQPPPPADATEIVDTGATLTPDKVDELATDLLKPYRKALDGFDTSERAETLHSLDQTVGYAQKALSAVQDKFGSYIEQPITLTTDPKVTRDQRIASHQVRVDYSFGDPDIKAFAVTIISTYCAECDTKLAPLTGESQDAVITALLEKVSDDADLSARVTRGAKHVGGAYSHAQRRLHLTPYTTDPYGDVVHEIIHAVTHPAFRAAFGASKHRKIVEGFTEYFAEEVTSSRDVKKTSYADSVKMITDVREAMGGPFFSYSLDSAEESLRLAYFGGRLDLIGWRPSSDAEDKAVQSAGGATAWSPATAQTELDARNKRGIAKQAPHDNVLGVGLLFQKSADSTFAVRYARVINRSEPFARRQIYLEGQLLGTPSSEPRRLGGSLGVGIELQEPWLYLTGGVRVVGTGAVSGPTDARVDISPFAGAGTRLWQRVRVGVEGFALFPVTGQSISVGGGATVGIEF